MFIVSVKMSKKKLLAIVTAGILLITGVLFTLGKMAAPAEAASGSISQVVKNNAEMVSYLESFGWKVSAEPCEIVEVSIPGEFNDVYENYNKLQKTQGFDLTEYKGEHVKRFTFEVLNYPDEPEYVRANLLVYENKVIAGDVSSVKSDGFIQGLQSIHS